MLSLLLFFFLISIVVSLLCSLWESVLLSITPSFVQVKLNENKRLGRLLASYKENIDQPLAALLTLNTVAHTVGAIGVGQQASIIWSSSAPIITTLVVPAVMTLAILLLSEIIPKTIGATHWKALTPFTVYSLAFIVKCLWPFVWGCQLITRALSRNKPEKSITRGDLLALTQIGTKEGTISGIESTFIENALRLKQYKVKDIMTPRAVMLAAAQTQTLKEFHSENKDCEFSRIPIYSGNGMDNATGFVLFRDILSQIENQNGDLTLSDIKRSISFKIESQSVFKLYNEFVQSREHIALVVNEHGAVSGLVTMEDVLECMLGQEIVDETDKVVDLQAYSRRQMKRRFGS
jgi:CBS domain containing-hemolysin-like protein